MKKGFDERTGGSDILKEWKMVGFLKGYMRGSIYEVIQWTDRKKCEPIESNVCLKTKKQRLECGARKE